MVQVLEPETAVETIEATVNYITNNGEKLFTYTGGPGSLDVRTGGTPDPHNVVIRNARRFADGFDLEREGFHFVRHDTKVADFFDSVMVAGVDGITVSPGYAYERAPDQQHFLNRGKTKQIFRDIFARGQGKQWTFVHSALFLDFLAGNQTYHCTPWGMPTRNVFGWQKPCYLLGEGYAKTFDELMAGTDWDAYGVGNYEKCADCMVHSGFEATAVQDTFSRPLKALATTLRGMKTEGEMAPEISLENQRPAQFVFSRHVDQKLVEIQETKASRKQATAA